MIILTGGIAGSSVLTALLSKAGYWTGEKTVHKPDYNTWENAELVGLNKNLLEKINFSEDWKMRFEPDFITRVFMAAQQIDPSPYRAFVEKCALNSPWIWKDPRLWLTIRYWEQFIDFEKTCFLVIKRDSLQAWTSTILRRQIQTHDYLNRYDKGVHQSILHFLEKSNASYLDILYEDLLIKPEKVIDQINILTGAQLNIDDLRNVFHGKLYRRQHGIQNHIKAVAIYLKNYRKRYR